MVSKPLDMKYVYKRDRYLEKRKALTESAAMPDFSEIKSPSLYKSKVENFVSKCSSYEDALNLLEMLYQDNKFDLLESATQVVINELIPTVENANLNDCIAKINSTNIGDMNKDRLIEAAKIYKAVDRIRSNHKNLAKRFELKENDSLYKSNKSRCNTICEMVDTYNLSPKIKFNIAIEEMVYLNYYEGKNNISESSMVKNIVDYFLLRENNTPEDIKDYRDSILRSKVLSEGADSEVQYLMNESDTCTTWQEFVDHWKVNPYKVIDSLIELARYNFSNLEALKGIIGTINEFSRINDMEFDMKQIFENMDSVNADQAHNIINVLEENHIESEDDLTSSLHTIWEAELNDEVYADGTETPQSFTSDEIDKFKMHNLITDAKDVGEFLDQMERSSMKESNLGIKRSNIVSDVDGINESNVVDYVDANGYISLNVRSYVYEGSLEDIHNLLENAIKCINNSLYNRDSQAYYVHRENAFDICIRTKYDVLLSEAQLKNKGFSNYEKDLICNLSEYASAIESINESPIYRILDKLSDRSYAANVSVDEVTLIYEILSPYINPDNNFMESFIDLCREEANPKFDRMKTSCQYIKHDTFDPREDHKARLEFCASVMGLEPLDESLKDVTDKVKNTFNNVKDAVSNKFKPKETEEDTEKKDDNAQPKKAVESQPNKKEEKPQQNKPEEKQPSKKEDNKEEETKDNKKPSDEDSEEKPEDFGKDKKTDSGVPEKDGKKGISLNDAKLAWQGVKSKLKGGSAKEQEMCRDLDMEFNHLCKSIKQTFVVDHREEIITGQVNRSISRIIKIAIALAATGGATSLAFGISPLLAPIFGAIAIFAKSKHTSTKEKKLIMDEIDIELQVLEREIQRAESSGSTKKYRELLSIQKNLQRRRQEIYYGLASKGKRVPIPSSMGARTRE